MNNIPKLYNTCLRKVSLFLKAGIWNSVEDENPFSYIPAKIFNDLVSTSLRIQTFAGFRAEGLKPLLTSGIVQEFILKNPICFCHKLCHVDWSSSENLCGFKNMEQEIAQALEFLSTASQNLEVLQLTHGGREKRSDKLSNALQKLIINSPNLKYIHSKIAFKLNVLRKCKKLKSILLHFIPEEPWYDFLEKENGNKQSFQILDSLEIFTICRDNWITLSEEKVSQYIVVLLMHCPSLISLGSLETSRALAKLHPKDLPHQVKLRRCHFKKGRWIRDAVACNPSVEELTFSTRCIRSIEHLRNFRNLVSLSLDIFVERDTTLNLDNILKDIGPQLKNLNLVLLENSVDISKLLKNCPNLESLTFYPLVHSYIEPAVILPSLKLLSLHGIGRGEQRLLPLFSGCHNLRELDLEGQGFDDKILEDFLKKNSLNNLKTAYFRFSELTKQGYKIFLLNAPNLEKVYASKEGMDLAEESDLESACIETNHKAVCINYCVRNRDMGFHKNLECNARR